jgi:hypothetical protein
MKIKLETALLYKSIFHVDADAVDRLNNRYTTMALVACFLIIIGKIYVGNPINCWGPSEYINLSCHWTNIKECTIIHRTQLFQKKIPSIGAQPAVTNNWIRVVEKFSIFWKKRTDRTQHYVVNIELIFVALDRSNWLSRDFLMY